MHPFGIHQMRLLMTTILFFLLVSVGSAQEKASQSRAPQEADDVVRVNTELVQTGLIVLDKQGRIVDGLQREQFELNVDGKPQPISFFESIATGSSKEEAQIKAARGIGPPQASFENQPGATISERGRAIFFFIDDLHLAPGNLIRTRQSLLQFINETMGRNDQTAIVSASGQIGFLQQFTTNKAVLRAAVERLSPIPYKVRDSERPPMSEYSALQITEQHDRELFNYFVDQTMKENRMDESQRPIAESMVQSRARMTMQQSDAVNKNSLLALASLVRSTTGLPGRKIVFFISDGFVPNLSGSDVTDTIRRITDAAARANVVIYSIDARGLVTDSWLDASNSGGFDNAGVLTRALTAERSFSQEALYALAADTGGRALFNSNSYEKGMVQALRETSVYYVLAWKPNNETQRDSKFHNIEVKVTGRPELKVLVQRGYFSVPVVLPGKELPGLNSSIKANTQLPIALSLGYGQTTGNHTLLTASMQIDKRALQRGAPAGLRDLDVEFMGAVVDARGKVVGSFGRRVNINLSKSSSESTDPTFSYLLRVAPGLYQVRVAAVDPRNKGLGDATDWIEIPAIEPGVFSLSSINTDEIRTGEPGSPSTEFSFHKPRTFASTSRFRLTIHIYNAAHKDSPPDVTVQIKILRGGQAISTTPELQVKVDKLTDLTSIPYSAEVSLKNLLVGHYVLQITALDRKTKATTSQEVEFAISPLPREDSPSRP